MAHRIGVEISDELAKTWSKSQEEKDFGLMEISIDVGKNQFVLVSYEKAQSDDVLKDIAGRLAEKKHQFFVVKDPLSKTNKFVLVHYGADLSPVKVRMIFASSRPTLKGHLGGDHFSDDYFLSTKEECTFASFNKRRNTDLDIDLRRADEMEKDEAMMDGTAIAVTSQVMKALDITVTSDAEKNAKAFASGNVEAAMFSLNPKDQSVLSDDCKESTMKGLASSLPAKHPRYFCFKFTHKDPKKVETTSTGCVYYCPPKANRNEKFTYSTCKINVLAFLEQAGITIDFKLEIEDGAELTEKECLNSLYPQRATAEQVDLSARPKPPGRKRKGRRKKVETKEVEE